MISLFKKTIAKDIFSHWFIALDSQPGLSWVSLDKEQFSESPEAKVSGD